MVMPPGDAHKDDMLRSNGLSMIKFECLLFNQKRREGKCGFE